MPSLITAHGALMVSILPRLLTAAGVLVVFVPAARRSSGTTAGEATFGITCLSPARCAEARPAISARGGAL